MERQLLKSQLLQSVGYDPARNLLHIEFVNHRVYEYGNIPQWLFDALLRADSAGKFFHREIRGKYPESEITPKSEGVEHAS